MRLAIFTWDISIIQAREFLVYTYIVSCNLFCIISNFRWDTSELMSFKIYGAQQKGSVSDTHFPEFYIPAFWHISVLLIVFQPVPSIHPIDHDEGVFVFLPGLWWKKERSFINIFCRQTFHTLRYLISLKYYNKFNN